MSEIDPIYKELAAKMGAANSKYVPWLLAKVANVEQARIVRELPASSDEIAKKLQIDPSLVDKHIQELIEKGLVFPTRKGPQMARNIAQFHDGTLNNPKFDESYGEEFFDLFGEMMDTEHYMMGILVGENRPGWRIIPRWKSIEDVPGVLPYEDVRAILKGQDTIAVAHCTCKREYRHRQCGTPTEVCIHLGRTAQHNIHRGAARKVTPEEALQVIEMTDRYPLIHTAPNQSAVNQLLCNCHRCCCVCLRPMLAQNEYKVYEGIAKSRFEAVVDADKCSGCKTCGDRCQFGAAVFKYYPHIGEERAYVDIEKCMGCGSCVVSCPAKARSMNLVRPPEHIPEGAMGLY